MTDDGDRVPLTFDTLDGALESVTRSVHEAVAAERARTELVDPDLRDAAFAYLERGGKCFRPLLVHLGAGAAGGDPDVVRSAALAVEVFHTWTLIHDDVIDHDRSRRGGPTVHVAFGVARPEAASLTPERARSYGEAVAILAGDYLQGVAVRLMLDSATEVTISTDAAQRATHLMQTDLVRDLVEGEMADVALTYRPVESVTEEAVVEMIRQKSAALLAYCAGVGALLALDGPDTVEGPVADLTAFAERIGIAFQIRDDVLGIVGDERKLGKPVGSDIREGKRTLVLLRAWAEADPAERRVLQGVVGRGDATVAEVGEVRRILEARGGLTYAAARAEEYVKEALDRLDRVPASPYVERLRELAELVVRRVS